MSARASFSASAPVRHRGELTAGAASALSPSAQGVDVYSRADLSLLTSHPPRLSRSPSTPMAGSTPRRLATEPAAHGAANAAALHFLGLMLGLNVV